MNACRILVLSALVFAASATSTAFAGDGAPGRSEGSAISRLKPEEIKYLESKFPEWTKLDPRRKEHIAHGVIRLRGMSVEERARFKERMERMRKHGGRKSRRDRQGGVLRKYDAVGARLMAKLPAAGRAEIARVDARPSAVRFMLFSLVKNRVAKAAGYEFSESERAALPEAMREKVGRLMAWTQDPSDEKRMRRARSALAHVRASLRFEAIRRQLVSTSEGGKVSSEQLAAAVVTTWSKEIDAVMAEIERDPKRFGEQLEQKSRFSRTRPDGVQSILMLEMMAVRKWKDDPEMQRAADKVVRRLLVDVVRADKDAVAALPGYEQPKQRMQALRTLTGAKGRARGDWRDKRRQGPQGGNRDGRPRRGAMGARNKRRPGGDEPKGGEQRDDEGK